MTRPGKIPSPAGLESWKNPVASGIRISDLLLSRLTPLTITPTRWSGAYRFCETRVSSLKTTVYQLTVFSLPIPQVPQRLGLTIHCFRPLGVSRLTHIHKLVFTQHIFLHPAVSFSLPTAFVDYIPFFPFAFFFIPITILPSAATNTSTERHVVVRLNKMRNKLTNGEREKDWVHTQTLSPSLPLSLSHTHTQTHRRARALWWAHSNAWSSKYTNARARALCALWRARAHTHTHTEVALAGRVQLTFHWTTWHFEIWCSRALPPPPPPPSPSNVVAIHGAAAGAASAAVSRHWDSVPSVHVLCIFFIIFGNFSMAFSLATC